MPCKSPFFSEFGQAEVADSLTSYGMKTDCDLTGDRYSWVGSAFYFGYLLASLPAAWAMQRYPIAKVIVACQFVWGILLLAMGFVSSFPALLALRIMLGMLEAPIIPGGILIMGMWYPRRDIALRLAFYYTGFAQLITGPIGYGYSTPFLYICLAAIANSLSQRWTPHPRLV